MKNPEDIKESVQGVMSDSEMIKSLQDDLKKARDDRDRLVDGFNEAQEKNLKYDAISAYYKKLVVDAVNEANEAAEINYEGVLDLDELEDQILRRFDISQYDDDIENIIAEFIKYDPRLDNIIAEKIEDLLSDCRIVVRS